MTCGGCAKAAAARKARQEAAKAAAEQRKAARSRETSTPPSGSPKTLSPARGVRQQFTLTARDGTTQSFGSRLEAAAERVRRGGGTITPE